MDDINENYYCDVIIPYQNKTDFLLEKINKYSNVFNLDEQKLTSIIKDNSDLFDSNKIINEDEKELEKELLLLTMDIDKNTRNYTDEDIKNNDEYVKDKNIKEIVKYYCDLFDSDFEKTFAIECWESGYYEQPIATSYNNPGALNSSKGSQRFSNIEEGIINHVILLKYNYFDKERDTFEKIERIYTEDKGHWLACVTSIYNKIRKDEIHIYDEKDLVLLKK